MDLVSAFVTVLTPRSEHTSSQEGLGCHSCYNSRATTIRRDPTKSFRVVMGRGPVAEALLYTRDGRWNIKCRCQELSFNHALLIVVWATGLWISDGVVTAGVTKKTTNSLLNASRTGATD